MISFASGSRLVGGGNFSAIAHVRCLLACLVAVAGAFLCGCFDYDYSKREESPEVKRIIAEASQTFQANHDGDRALEGALLFPRVRLGFSKSRVREFLGDPTPGIGGENKWVYELYQGHSMTFFFNDDEELETKFRLEAPIGQPPKATNKATKAGTDEAAAGKNEEKPASRGSTGDSPAGN